MAPLSAHAATLYWVGGHEDVEAGSSASLPADITGVVDVRRLAPEEQSDLEADFDAVFEETVNEPVSGTDTPERSFRVVMRKELP